MAMLIEARDPDAHGHFTSDTKGVLDLVGNVKGCDCILIEVRKGDGERRESERKRNGRRHR